MKPEEKYFVIKGIREDTQTWEVEEGFWLYRKDGKGRIHRGDFYTGFYTDKKKAESECEKLREKYQAAIAYIKEGDSVWFINRRYIQHRNVADIIDTCYDMYYVIEDTDDFYKSDYLFKTKQELLEYLDKHINE